MTTPKLFTDVWLHDGFTVEQFNAYEYTHGFGLELTLGESQIHVVFGSRTLMSERDEVLAGQEAAARKAAEVFTAIADRLAALRSGTRAVA